MSAFSGPCYRGAMRDYRETKRKQAGGRNRRTPPERRRRGRAGTRLVDLIGPWVPESAIAAMERNPR